MNADIRFVEELEKRYAADARVLRLLQDVKRAMWKIERERRLNRGT